MYHPEWGQSKWSGQLRKTHWQGHPDAFWTSGPSAHAATFRPLSRGATPREALSASERLYRNERRYSRSTGRFRSGPACRDTYATRAAHNDARRRTGENTGFVAPERFGRPRPKSASAATRRKEDVALNGAGLKHGDVRVPFGNGRNSQTEAAQCRGRPSSAGAARRSRPSSANATARRPPPGPVTPRARPSTAAPTATRSPAVLRNRDRDRDRDAKMKRLSELTVIRRKAEEEEKALMSELGTLSNRPRSG
jgi:hypothetical protein